MAKKVDVEGLQAVYFTLGQMQEALKMHAEDTDNLAYQAGFKRAGDKLNWAQNILSIILKEEIGVTTDG